MAYKKDILLGKITKVHSYEGAVTIRLEKSISDNITEMESVFIETDGRPVPFFIEYAEQPDNRTLRMKFSGYDSDKKMKEFVGCNIYITKTGSTAIPFDDYLSIKGFEVFSDEENRLGLITDIFENPGQLLLNIRSGSGKDILLPLHEDLIKEIDKDKKRIIMFIPEGIEEIN
jgi:16S rRNA processing protein RimM